MRVCPGGVDAPRGKEVGHLLQNPYQLGNACVCEYHVRGRGDWKVGR